MSLFGLMCDILGHISVPRGNEKHDGMWHFHRNTSVFAVKVCADASLYGDRSSVACFRVYHGRREAGVMGQLCERRRAENRPWRGPYGGLYKAL